MKLLVRNLPRSITAEELRDMFSTYGAVQSCNLVMDSHSGLSKGFGFVEIPKIGNAKAAIKNLNGHRLNGQAMRVKKAEDKPQTNTSDVVKPEPATRDNDKTSPWK